jgi:class 3 adenylate cyclase
MPPEEVIALLNEHMETLTRVVHEHQGVVDKFVGDLIMALFGAPKSYGHDADRAARCALRMIQEREKLNQRSRHFVQIGIGISTGTVVAGCMGASNRVGYTVLGERVNLAARLCAQAGPGEILLDCTTRELLPATASVKQLPLRKLKGFSEPIPVWELRNVGSLSQHNAS